MVPYFTGKLYEYQCWYHYGDFHACFVNFSGITSYLFDLSNIIDIQKMQDILSWLYKRNG